MDDHASDRSERSAQFNRWTAALAHRHIRPSRRRLLTSGLLGGLLAGTFRWNNDDLHELQDRIHGTNFEAIDTSSLMRDPDSGQVA